ncbi:alpha-amylase family protein [Paenibacillus sp. IITD108]|uniref:alpha-amylase family protein n=1 Tax=Paenibacillus sp. IITD108 TaxID=3116649 RepID=UPI002F4027EF
MRFRQVHLDFHTSEAIEGIGSSFSKKQFQEMLMLGRVDSITVFAKCHHGWAYHPSKANDMHPQLDFDLLGAQIEAAHEINVLTPIYISAGLDEKLARRRPQWLIRDQQEKLNWASDFMSAGYHQFCMNTPYLDVLVEQVAEVVRSYDADGIFLDIVGIRKCYCQFCVAKIRERGSDPRNLADMKLMWEETYHTYTKRINETIHGIKRNLPIFHNSGHITRGRRDLAHKNTHLELESLPTGGWGYDHFPLSARYAQTLGMNVLGMTGKFHESWGEFGGYKHPNALRYETALSLANGSGCSIGDQLHPAGLMDKATYSLIGAAYKEVEAKEAWCTDTSAISEIALLSFEAISSFTRAEGQRVNKYADVGAARVLLEGHYLFDVIDMEADFSPYKVIILPDAIVNSDLLMQKINAFLAGGGKLLASGKSGLDEEETSFAWDFGANWNGMADSCPSYFLPEFPLQALEQASFVMYTEAQHISLADAGIAHGTREDSYFNRDLFTFCSHRHTPSTLQPAGIGMSEGKDGIYIAWNVFEEYATKGSLHVKEMVCFALDQLLPNKKLVTNLPAQGITTLQAQPAANRWINHLLYAAPVKRGLDIEVIEDLLPLRNIEVAIEAQEPVQEVYLAPQLAPLPFTQADGIVRYTVPEWACHQMIVLQF